MSTERKVKITFDANITYFDDSKYFCDHLSTVVNEWGKRLMDDVRKPLEDQAMTSGPGPWQDKFTIKEDCIEAEITVSMEDIDQ